jgi:hypothetical protein
MSFPPPKRFNDRTNREILAAVQRVQSSFYSPQVIHVNRAYGSSVELPHYVQPTVNTNGASGTFPTGNSNGSYVMPAFTANVYQASNGVLTRVAVNATVYNPYGAPIMASKTCRVTPDGTGAYYIDAESCT